MSCSVTTSGGTRRSASGATALTIKPCSNAQFIAACAHGWASSTASSKPRPRTETKSGLPQAMSRHAIAWPRASALATETVFLNGFQRGHRGGRSERIAAKGGAVGAWGEQCGKLGAEGDHATHRETACNALGEGYDIRNHSAREILTLEREPGSGASDACLDLIDDEQRVVVVAHLTGLLHVVGAERTHASLTLDQFHDDGCDRTFAIFAGTGFGQTRHAMRSRHRLRRIRYWEPAVRTLLGWWASTLRTTRPWYVHGSHGSWR